MGSPATKGVVLVIGGGMALWGLSRAYKTVDPFAPVAAGAPLRGGRPAKPEQPRPPGLWSWLWPSKRPPTGVENLGDVAVPGPDIVGSPFTGAFGAPGTSRERRSQPNVPPGGQQDTDFLSEGIAFITGGEPDVPVPPTYTPLRTTGSTSTSVSTPVGNALQSIRRTVVSFF